MVEKTREKSSKKKTNEPMNFIAICLHCLDMRDFHSYLRKTPFLDELREKSIFIPMGRGQGHHQKDSLNAEITGVWTARYSGGILTKERYNQANLKNKPFPKTVMEYMKEKGYEIITCMGYNPETQLGSVAGLARGKEDMMSSFWMADQPERWEQFNCPKKMNLNEWLAQIKNSEKFYAHIFLRGTHRPWAQPEELLKLAGKEEEFLKPVKKSRSKFINLVNRIIKGKSRNYTELDLVAAARRLALEKPSEFAELRRRGLEKTDRDVRKIFEATKHLKNVTYIVYSNHGEVFDHFRYNRYHRTRKIIKKNIKFIEGTSHAALPYEVLYANMQMWLIPGEKSKVMQGMGRSIDITPTLLELAKVTPEKMDGESMLSQFSEGFFPDRDRYAEVPPKRCISLVRKDGYKFISNPSPRFPEHRMAVFDLKTDPYEYVNLINTPKGQEVLDWAIKKHESLRE